MNSHYQNPWMYEGKKFCSEDIDDAYGMVYLITNMKTGKMYVGKKFFWKPRTRTVKGKKKRELIESDWKDYYGSSNKLLKDVEELGVDMFSRSVLRLCKNKNSCAYWELKEQVDRDVLLREDYYNEFIGGKINSRGLS